MLKFYYSGAPNPMKVALMLEETGLPYEAVPVDTRKGEQHTPEFLAINPNAKVPAIVDGDATVFDSNAILLYLAEKTGKFLPAKTRQAARRIAVLADVRRLRRRAVFRPVGALPPIRAGKDSLRHQPLHVSRRSAITAFSKRGSPSRNTWSATPTASSTWRCGAGRGSSRTRSARNTGPNFPNLKRLVDEISARPAAARANELRDKHKFKTEFDEEAKSAMFGHLDVKVA